jgi:hypothetical protein
MALLKFCGHYGVRSGGKLAVVVLAWRSKRMKSKLLPFVIEFEVMGLIDGLKFERDEGAVSMLVSIFI